MNKAFLEAIRRYGGQTKTSVAINRRQSMVSYWAHKSKKGPPGDVCLKIECDLGIPASSIRPDIYPPERFSETSSAVIACACGKVRTNPRPPNSS